MSTSPAADRTLTVLELLASSPEPLSAGYIASELGIPRASLYRLLATMTDHGFTAPVAETNRWTLGIGAYELAWAYRRQSPLQRVVRPILARLVDATGQSGHFTVLQGTDVVYLIEERAPHRPSLVTDVGVGMPAHLTASGLAMLATLTTAQVRALYPDASSLVTRRGHGPTSLGELRGVLAETRRRGYAIEDDIVTPGFRSVAMPILDQTGHPLGAITLTTAHDSTDAPRLDAELVAAIARATAAVQARLGLSASRG